MAIADTISSMQTNLGNAYTALTNKGATILSNKNLENLAVAINSVPLQICHIEQVVDGDNCSLSITDYVSQLTDNYLVAVFQEDDMQKIYILEEIS